MKSSAELDNMLLQVAGRGGSDSHKYKSQRRSSYSSSDSEPEPTANTRKKMKMPLKKRHPSSSESDQESDRDSDSAGSFGSDLYKDEDDKEQLEKLSELDREMILAERGTRRDDYRLKKLAASKAPPSASTRERERERVSSASKRTADKSSTRSAALQGLRDRMHKKDPERFRNHYKHLGGGDTHDRSPPSTRHRGSSPPLGEGDNEGRNIDSDHNDDELPEDSPRMQSIKYEDVKEVTILRSRLLKWFMDPFFEDLLPGCFVRVGIHQHKDGRRKYRLYMVRNVDASDPDRTYKFEHYTTYKYLILTRSESAVDKCKMAEVSDSPPTESEFEELLQLAESKKMRLPGRQELLDKKEALQKALNFVYSAETVKQLLQEKKLASLRPTNVAAEKDRLRKELEVARARHDEAEADRILARLKQLEQMQPKQTDSKAARLAEMNRRNRAENFKNASEMKPVNIGLKSGEAGYDPFSRRWTRSRNYYMSKPDGEGSAANAETEGGVKEEEKGVAETAAAQEAAAGAGKLVDTKAVADPGTAMYQLHNFEVHIDLTKLQQLGSTPAERVFRGRLLRRQRQEISIGRKVPESDGKRHPLTLSVSDYKRRRGLL